MKLESTAKERELYIFYCKSFHWDIKGICFAANCYYVWYMDFFQTLFILSLLKKKKKKECVNIAQEIIRDSLCGI